MKKLYLAGKIARNDWRHDLVPNLDGAGSKPIPGRGFTYVGPFFSDYACHGGSHGPDTHGTVWTGHDTPAVDVYEDRERATVARSCLEQISRCDILFAWLDDATAYGTLVEIGYARALNKQVVVASPRPIATRGWQHGQASGGYLPDLWFAAATASLLVHADCAVSAVSKLLDHIKPKVDPALALLESPIEKQFWAQHTALKLPALAGLVPQHPVLGGRYRLDFALPDQRVAVELDGYEYHSSKEAFVRDRERQRALETAGWRVIRFAGSEVYNDPAGCVRQTAALVSR